MCWFVPPTNSVTLYNRMAMDGVLGSEEWAGATSLAYVDYHQYATGQVHLRAGQWEGRGRWPLDRRRRWGLYVYLDGIPIRADTHFALFIDHDRFSTERATGGPEDRVYSVSLFGQGSKQVYQTIPVDETTVDLAPIDERFDFVKGECETGHQDGVTRCDAELWLPLPASAYEPPADGLLPGVGFAAFTFNLDGSTPEETALAKWQGDGVRPWNQRLDAETLLLGPPEGFAARYMSWNIKRSTITNLVGDFMDVDPADIGSFVAGTSTQTPPYEVLGNDIVAIQEGWNVEQMEQILAHANVTREWFGLPPFQLYGPVNHPDAEWGELAVQVGAQVVGDEGTTGGLWILTHLPVVRQGFHYYDVCRGEDCFKAKGVQWVRVLLNPPDAQNSGDRCEPGTLGTTAPAACGLPFSGDHYVDVFNTHMQSPSPWLCSADGIIGQIEASLLAIAAMGPGGFNAALSILTDLAADNWNCYDTDDSIQIAQLDQLNSFVTAVMSERPDRPAIIMGDFNLDGRCLGFCEGAGEDYAALLGRLEIGPAPGASSCLMLDDTVNPWPLDFEWDIDHGDVARERAGIDWYATNPHAGTMVGTGSVLPLDGDACRFVPEDHRTACKSPGAPRCSFNCEDAPDCEFVASYDGGEGSARNDYILVRSPVRTDRLGFEAMRWVAGKVEGQEWSSPFPALVGNYPGPPGRLSDHKPVVAGIQLVPLQLPPKYHKMWSHTVKFQVTTANSTGVEDCDGCDQVDQYIRAWGFSVVNGSVTTILDGDRGRTCLNRQVVSWPIDADCLESWFFHDPSRVSAQNSTQHEYVTRLWDEDDTSGDDKIFLLLSGWPSWPRWRVNWNVPAVGIRSEVLPSTPVGEDLPINDTLGLDQCTGGSPSLMCVHYGIEEYPPSP